MENSNQNEVININDVINLRVAGLISKAGAYMMTKLNKLSEATARKLAANQIEVRDTTFLHTFRVNVGATGTVAVMDNAQGIEQGVSDFDKGKTDKDTYIAIEQIGLEYGGAAAAYTPKTKVFSPFVYDISGAVVVPAAVLNGRFILYANNKPVVELPVSEMMVKGREYQGSEQVKELGTPKIIPGDTQLKAEIVLATNEAVTGTASHIHHFRVNFRGAGTFATPGN